MDFLTKWVISLNDPRSLYQAIKGSKLGEFWKYRVRDFRIIASIQNQKMIILFCESETGERPSMGGTSRGKSPVSLAVCTTRE